MHANAAAELAGLLVWMSAPRWTHLQHSRASKASHTHSAGASWACDVRLVLSGCCCEARSYFERRRGRLAFEAGLQAVLRPAVSRTYEPRTGVESDALRL